MTPQTQIKQWLAEKLREKEKILYSPYYDAFFWLADIPENNSSQWSQIKDTEWPYIVGLVEGNLSEEQWTTYERCLLSERIAGTYQFLISLNWPTRAECLKVVLDGKEKV